MLNMIRGRVITAPAHVAPSSPERQRVERADLAKAKGDREITLRRRAEAAHASPTSAERRGGSGFWFRGTEGGHVDIGRIFEPEAVFPDVPVPEQTPERRLLLAVLQDAIEHIGRGDRSASGKGTAAEARAWVASRDRSWPFAFEAICDALGLEPDYIRRGLVNYRPTVKLHLHPGSDSQRRIGRKAA
jgi:hypothetical protein